MAMTFNGTRIKSESETLFHGKSVGKGWKEKMVGRGDISLYLHVGEGAGQGAGT